MIQKAKNACPLREARRSPAEYTCAYCNQPIHDPQWGLVLFAGRTGKEPTETHTVHKGDCDRRLLEAHGIPWDERWRWAWGELSHLSAHDELRGQDLMPSVLRGNNRP